MKENILILRNFLYKFFIVGFLLFILSAVMFIFCKDFGAELAQSWYGIEPQYYYNVATALLAFIKIYLFFFVLCPALALHWLICCCKCKKEKE